MSGVFLFAILHVGTAVWYLFHVAPIENEENTVVLFLITVRDISEYKEPIVGNGKYLTIILYDFRYGEHLKQIYAIVLVHIVFRARITKH